MKTVALLSVAACTLGAGCSHETSTRVVEPTPAVVPASTTVVPATPAVASVITAAAPPTSTTTYVQPRTTTVYTTHRILVSGSRMSKV
jgi:hypothetical protein